MADETTGLKESRPTIVVDNELNGPLGGGLLTLMIVENTNGLYRCEAKFGNWGEKNSTTDFLYFDRSVLDFGKDFEIKLGNDSIFKGKIMGLEGNFPEGQSPEISVLAEDRFQDLRMTRRTRTFTDVSDADVIKQIATDHGLTPEVDVPGPTYKVLAQVNQSDLAFIRDRARSIDAEVWMSDKTLHAKAHTGRNGDKLQMTYGNQLREFNVLADLAMQRTSVAVNGWNISNKAAMQFEATDSAISSELNGDTSGVSILQSALGERKEALAHTIPLNDQEAQHEAEAFFRMSARRFVVGHGIAETNKSLRAGSQLDLQGLGPLFNGKYYVAEVKHIFDSTKGLRSEFRSERVGIGK
ncbi:MAG TPA: contractile injection system protein, VgrG/Pvc8 family [Pyrinomonadaceae bacterium]|jgi:Bacteriophage probable baseplate hub protein|nr:contractile injection system protein, VgrG/Pvc8 family [Pyrinomonadaceae bacterium]